MKTKQDARNEIELGVDRPKYGDVQIVAEVGPDTDEDHEARDFGALELEIVEDRAEGEADFWDVHG